ncbi:DHHA1 domain protein [uncultured archaeon]|nr:DHHA1 domain protein [uncultured archaeon]
MFNQEKFFAFIEEQLQVYSKFKKPLIVHHFDADGLTSGTLCISGFEALGISFESICVKRLDYAILEEVLKLFKEKNCSELVFVDLGSGFVEELKKVKIPMLILDHHNFLESKDELLKYNIIQVNLRDFDGNGDFEACAASTVFFAFKKFSQTRFPPEIIALLGATGDYQQVGGFRGLNKLIFEKALKEGLLDSRVDLNLYGKNNRPLNAMLCYSSDPLLPGLTGNNESCLSFVKSLGFDLTINGKWKTYFDLTEQERIVFTSKLFEFLLNNGFNERQLKHLLGPIFIVKTLEKTSPFMLLDEFTTILNACGRNNQGEVGVGLLKGVSGAEEKALQVLALHRTNLKNAFAFGATNVQDFKNFYLIDGRTVISDSIIGIVAGSVLFSLPVKNKPIIGLSLDDDDSTLVKASGRAPKLLAEKNFSIGKIFNKIGVELGGQGGGHDLAGGLTFPSDKVEKLFIALEKEFEVFVN